MPTPQQLNFRGMVDSVLTKFPLYDSIQVKLDINDILRGIIARRAWSGLVKYGQLQIAPQYTVGTVNTTQNSNIVTGVGTTWLWNDLVSTTLETTLIETGTQTVTPASMTGIQQGMWLTLDGGTSQQEGVFVLSIDATGGTFTANFGLLHSTGAPITAGSMAGRQLRTQSNTPFMTIVGLTSPTQLLLNAGWPYISQSSTLYEITCVYVSLGQDCKEFLTMVNPDRQYSFDLASKTQLDVIDPRRAFSQMPYKIAFHTSDPGGAPLFELWPRPTSLAAYPYFYIAQWLPLVNDTDLLPNGIRSDVVVKMARSEAACWPGHKKVEGGIYYDPQLAARYMTEAEKGIQEMKNEDDSTAIMQLVYQYRKWKSGGPPPDWFNVDVESYYV